MGKRQEEKSDNIQYIQKFLIDLELLLSKLEKLNENKFPKDYTEILIRVSASHIKKIYRWIGENSRPLEILSVDNPIRIQAFQKRKLFSFYPFPVTIHFVLDRFGVVRLIFTPNSKLASISKNIIKDPEVKFGEKPKKRRGEGLTKIVNDAYCLENGKIKPYVASIMIGEMALLESDRLRKFYKNLDLPYILIVYYGAKYKGHSYKDYGKDKQITFSPRAFDELFSLINNMNYFKPTLINIFDIIIKMTAGIKKLHDIGEIHRDVKPENILIFRNKKNKMLNPFLHDLGYLINKTQVKSAGLAGTLLYMPWDSKAFSKLLKFHNQAIKETKDFASNVYNHADYSKKKIYDAGVKDRLKYRELIKFYINNAYSETIKDFTNSLLVSDAVKELIRAEAIEIILENEKPIKIYPYQDFKDDIYALCKTFKYLVNSFCEYKNYNKTPRILTEINYLLNKNIKAPRKERVNANELLICLHFLFKKMINNPIKFLGSEENNSIFIKNFITQYYSILKVINFQFVTLVAPPTGLPVSMKNSFNNNLISSPRFTINKEIKKSPDQGKTELCTNSSCLLL